MPVPRSPPAGYGFETAAVILHGHFAQLHGHWAYDCNAEDVILALPDTVATHATREIAFGKLDPSPINVRRTGATVGVEALAASIAAHGLLQSLVVRAKRDGRGRATGRFEVVAGGRRLAALRILAGGGRLAKDAPIPCRILAGDAAEGAAEASLAENVVRLDMHPADQFEAFSALHRDGAGLGVEEIAARFGASAHTVRQRLRLAGVAPAIVAAYREGALTLDHVTAFAASEDREAQERVHADLAPWQRTPETIRRLLTHALTPVTDRRVRLVGLDAYLATGGRVQRDLFTEDGGGWLTDAALLESLLAERLEAEAEAVRAEGWRWVAIGPEAQSDAWRCRRVWPGTVPLTEEEEARRTELSERDEELATEHGSDDELPEEVAGELDAIAAELAALDARERRYRPEDVALAGAVVTLAGDGTVRVERGYVRPEDEPAPEPVAAEQEDDAGEGDAADQGDTITPAGTPLPSPASAEAEDPSPHLSAALEGELEAHRTAGLQAELVNQPRLAFRVLLHGLATDALYARYGETVARFTAYPPSLGVACPTIADSPARVVLTEAEAAWRARLPAHHADLWTWLAGADDATLPDLLAFLVARVSDAGRGDWTGERGARCVPAAVAGAASLDMRRWWTATPEGYVGRVPKALILDAVREGAGEEAARPLRDAKKDAMVAAASELLDGKGWLPVRLRVPTPAREVTAEEVPADAEAANDDAPVPAVAAE